MQNMESYRTKLQVKFLDPLISNRNLNSTDHWFESFDQ